TLQIELTFEISKEEKTLCQVTNPGITEGEFSSKRNSPCKLLRDSSIQGAICPWLFLSRQLR
uniref:Uncharacterized protein n=1 Tax=Chlorocebus sabaeus TaxID=60711 RepID=A0A0D9RQ68_CHLSB